MISHMRIPHLNGAISFRFPRSGERQAAFLRLIQAGGSYDFGVKHDRSGAVIIKNNGSPGNADHVRRHSYTAVTMSRKGVSQILRDGNSAAQPVRTSGQERWDL